MSFEILPIHYQCVAYVLFGIGVIGALLRRNALVLLMCIELTLNAANLSFVAYAKTYGELQGHVAVFFVMAVAAAEAAIGLAIILGIFRTRQSVDVDELDLLRDET